MSVEKGRGHLVVELLNLKALRGVAFVKIKRVPVFKIAFGVSRILNIFKPRFFKLLIPKALKLTKWNIILFNKLPRRKLRVCP